MGFFMNSKKHPDLFTKEPPQTNHQSYWRVNFLSKLLNQQQITSNSVQATLKQIQQLQKKYHLQQTTRWTEVQRQYVDLQKKFRENEKSFRSLMEHVHDIQTKTATQGSLWDDMERKQIAFLQQLEQIEKRNELIFQRIDRYEKEHHGLLQRLHELENLQQETFSKIAGQTERQQEIVDQLDNHGALLDKIMRQVEYIREIIFERSHFLSTKVEQGWQYVMHFFARPNGTKTPSALPEEEKEKLKS